MSNLTTEQLAELTRRFNERLDELGGDFGHWSRGFVRMAYDVIEEWQGEQEKIRVWPSAPAEDLLMDGFHIGYQMARLKSSSVHANNGDAKAVHHAAPDTYPDNAPRAPLDAAIAKLADALVNGDLAAAINGDVPKPEPEYRIVRPSLARYIKPGLTMAQKQTVAEQEAKLHEVIATIQTIAVDGQMPSITAYRAARPKHLPEWTTITTRYLIATWRQMAELCGLRYAPAMRAPEPDGDDDEPRYRTKPNGKTRKKDTSKPGPESDARKTGPTRADVIAFLQNMAMAGVMPSQSQFNLARPATWGTATAQLTRLHTTWDELRAEAGLKPNPRAAHLQPAQVDAAT